MKNNLSKNFKDKKTLIIGIVLILFVSALLLIDRPKATITEINRVCEDGICTVTYRSDRDLSYLTVTMEMKDTHGKTTNKITKTTKNIEKNKDYSFTNFEYEETPDVLYVFTTSSRTKLGALQIVGVVLFDVIVFLAVFLIDTDKLNTFYTKEEEHDKMFPLDKEPMEVKKTENPNYSFDTNEEKKDEEIEVKEQSI